MPPPGAASFEGLLSDRQIEVDRDIGRELAQKSLSGKFNFSVTNDMTGKLTYENSPFRAHASFANKQLGPWAGSVNLSRYTRPDNPLGQFSWLNTEVGVQGQGTSGQISPWGNLRVSPFEGLNFNVRGQRFPGTNFNLISPSVSYQGQFKHPLDKWTGPLHVNAEKRFGQQPTGMLSVRGDF